MRRAIEAKQGGAKKRASANVGLRSISQVACLNLQVFSPRLVLIHQMPNCEVYEGLHGYLKEILILMVRDVTRTWGGPTCREQMQLTL